jgi:hypothetical protein
VTRWLARWKRAGPSASRRTFSVCRCFVSNGAEAIWEGLKDERQGSIISRAPIGWRSSTSRGRPRACSAAPIASWCQCPARASGARAASARHELRHDQDGAGARRPPDGHSRRPARDAADAPACGIAVGRSVRVLVIGSLPRLWAPITGPGSGIRRRRFAGSVTRSPARLIVSRGGRRLRSLACCQRCLERRAR